MRRMILSLLSTLLVIHGYAGCTGLFSCPHQQAKDKALLLYADYQKALDTLLPLDWNSRIDNETAWRMNIRITPSEGPESLLKITKDWNGKSQLSLTQPANASKSIWDEFQSEDSRAAGLNGMMKKIRLVIYSTDTDQSKPLRALIESLEANRVALIPSSDIILHYDGYEIKSQTRTNAVDLSTDCLSDKTLCQTIEQIVAIMHDAPRRAK